MLLARYPLTPDDLGRDLSQTEIFREAMTRQSGSFVRKAAIDGVSRLYTFRHVTGLPLVVSVNVEADAILRPWRHKAWSVGAGLAMLCSATIALCFLLRREMLRRKKAEDTLIETADKFAAMAATDSLMGLAS